MRDATPYRTTLVRILAALLLLGAALLSARFPIPGHVIRGAAARAGDHRDHVPPGSWQAQSHGERVLAMAPEDTLITYRVTSANAVALHFYNNGFFGNNMASRNPSFEYPVGSEEEHMVRGGMWVGGLFSETGEIADAETLVTTATMDGYFGSSGQETESEFFPASSKIVELSSILQSPHYSPDAVSDQDFYSRYTDRHGHATEDHKPLYIHVSQQILQFGFEPYDAIVFVVLSITNIHPTHLLYDVYAGFYAEFASGWKGQHEDWPPSGWFSNKDIAYVDSLRQMNEHHWTEDNGTCPSWAGCQLLGTEPVHIDSMRISFQWWDWDPDGANPDTPHLDKGRYEAMSSGWIDNTDGPEAPRYDPVQLLAVGPLGTASFEDDDGLEHWFLEPGDSVSVVFALLGGQPRPDTDPPRNAEEDIVFHGVKAQEAYDLDFNIPVPPPSPVLLVENYHSTIQLWWDDSPLYFVDPRSHIRDFEGFRVHVSEEGKSVGFRLVKEFDIRDSINYDTGLEAVELDEPRIEIDDEGDTTAYCFRYDLEGVRDGFKYWVAVTSFDMGSPEMGQLESGLAQNRLLTIPGATREETPREKVVVFPNPYRGDAAWDGALSRDRYLWFAGLPRRCSIRIYNLAGDHVQTIEFDGDTYGATDVRGIFDPTDPNFPEGDIPELSGHMAAWNLTSRMDQAVATGLYLFSVEDLDTGLVERGKFLILR
jgi:hypothetical protein